MLRGFKIKSRKTQIYNEIFVVFFLPENLTDSSEMESETNDSVYLSLLLLGQCFHGVAGAAMCILIPTYLDENIHITNTPFYIGQFTRRLICDPTSSSQVQFYEKQKILFFYEINRLLIII